MRAVTEFAVPASLDSAIVSEGIARRALGAAVIVVASLALTSCVGHNPATAARDQHFLAELHQAMPNITQVRSNTALVRLGHAVCDEFDAGVSSLQIADRLGVDDGDLPSQDLGAVMKSAVDVLCPRYRSDL